jgi:electron transfer flavoprotein beta subunit
VVTVLSGAYKPRYMTVNGIVGAYEKVVEFWGYEQIDVEESKLGLKGSPTRVHKAFSRGVKAPGELYEVDTNEAVGIIISKLKEKFII